MAEAVKPLRPVKAHSSGATAEAIAKPAPVLERAPESKLWTNIQAGKFQISVEIDPPKGIALDRVYEQVEKIM